MRILLRGQRARGLIQKKNSKVHEHCTGDGDALLLTAGQLKPALTDRRSKRTRWRLTGAAPDPRARAPQ
jgi:hypothetical protein